MKTTLKKYNKLCDMNIINAAKYDINARVELIIEEVRQQLQKWDEDARSVYFPEKKNGI